MNTTHLRSGRRGFLGTLAFGATAFAARGAFAEELTRTPTTNEGPFYPTKLPLDTDNDLLIAKGGPIRNATSSAPCRVSTAPAPTG